MRARAVASKYDPVALSIKISYAAVLGCVYWMVWAKTHYDGPRLRRGDMKFVSSRLSASRKARIAPLPPALHMDSTVMTAHSTASHSAVDVQSSTGACDGLLPPGHLGGVMVEVGHSVASYGTEFGRTRTRPSTVTGIIAQLAHKSRTSLAIPSRSAVQGSGRVDGSAPTS